MAVSEAARLDQYIGLAEILGQERASTLMNALPLYDASQLATKADIGRLEDRIGRLEDRMDVWLPGPTA